MPSRFSVHDTVTVTPTITCQAGATQDLASLDEAHGQNKLKIPSNYYLTFSARSALRVPLRDGFTSATSTTNAGSQNLHRMQLCAGFISPMLNSLHDRPVIGSAPSAVVSQRLRGGRPCVSPSFSSPNSGMSAYPSPGKTGEIAPRPERGRLLPLALPYRHITTSGGLAYLCRSGERFQS